MILQLGLHRLCKKNFHVGKVYKILNVEGYIHQILSIIYSLFLLGFTPGKRERNYLDNLELHFWLGVVLFITSIVIAIGVANKMYQHSIKKTLFPKLLKSFF